MMRNVRNFICTGNKLFPYGSLLVIGPKVRTIFSSFLKKSELISAVWLGGWLAG
jgi:hypothetical protein